MQSSKSQTGSMKAQQVVLEERGAIGRAEDPHTLKLVPETSKQRHTHTGGSNVSPPKLTCMHIGNYSGTPSSLTDTRADQSQVEDGGRILNERREISGKPPLFSLRNELQLLSSSETSLKLLCDINYVIFVFLLVGGDM